MIQIYVSKPVSFITRPPKELKAFRKVFVQRKETETLTISIPLADLAYNNILLNKWVVEPGEYDLYLATSSQNEKQQQRIVVEGHAAYSIHSTTVGIIG